MTRLTTVFPLLLLLLPAAALARADEPVLAEGAPFPGLVLPSIDGGAPASIADFRGEKVVLHVFASW